MVRRGEDINFTEKTNSMNIILSIIYIIYFPFFSPQSISLTVIASDGALPSTRKSSSISLSIIGSRTLPGLSFETESYNAVVVENSPVGTPIVTVSLNGDPLEKVEYHIIGCESQDAGKDRGLFNIDKFTGQVTTGMIIFLDFLTLQSARK